MKGVIHNKTPRSRKELVEYIKNKYGYYYSHSSDSFGVGRQGYIAKSGLDYQALVLDHNVVVYFAEWIYSQLKDSGCISFQFVGMETSGIPLVSSMSMYLTMKYGLEINKCYIRKNKDSSGKNNYIEGNFLEDVPIVFVDEHFFTGDTLRKSELILEIDGYSINKAFFLVNSQYRSHYKRDFIYTLIDDTEVLPVFFKPETSKLIFAPLKKISSMRYFIFLAYNSYLNDILKVSQYNQLDNSLVISYLNNLFKINFQENGFSVDRVKVSFLSNNYKVKLLSYDEGQIIYHDNIGIFWTLDDFSKKKIITLITEITLFKVIVGVGLIKNTHDIIVCYSDRFSPATEVAIFSIKRKKYKNIFKIKKTVSNFAAGDNFFCIWGEGVAEFFNLSGELQRRETNIQKVTIINNIICMAYFNSRVLVVNGNMEREYLNTYDEQTEVFLSREEIIFYSKTGVVKYISKNITWEIVLSDSVILEPLIHNDYVLITTLRGTIYILNKTTGTTIVMYEFGDQILSLSLVEGSKILCICAKIIYFLRIDENSFKDNDLGINKVYIN